MKILAAIAKKHLGLETLESRNSDSLDFSDQAAWSIEAALKAAFIAGQEAGNILILTFECDDLFYRKTYKDQYGINYVAADGIIHTINEFDEPLSPLKKNHFIED